jgi:ABC-type transport system substrate-binding protein
MSKLLTKNFIGKNQNVQTSTAETFNAGDVIFTARKGSNYETYLVDGSNRTCVSTELGAAKANVETTLEQDGLIFTSYDTCTAIDGTTVSFTFVTINENYLKTKYSTSTDTFVQVYKDEKKQTFFTLKFTGVQ